jgi:hypothetical protein
MLPANAFAWEFPLSPSVRVLCHTENAYQVRLKGVQFYADDSIQRHYRLL